MGDSDLQAVMTGLQEVLPVLDQAQDLLQDDSSQRRPSDTKGWSSTWNGRPKACTALWETASHKVDLRTAMHAGLLDVVTALRQAGDEREPVI